MKQILTMQNPQKTLCVILSVCLLSVTARAGMQWLVGGHAGDVTTVACSPDGEVVATAGDDSTVKFWSMDGALLWTLNVHPCQAASLAFSPDGTKLAVGTYHGPAFNEGRGDVMIWSASGGWTSNSLSLIRTSTLHLGKVSVLAFSADSTRLASGGAEGTNVVQQVSDGARLQTLSAHTSSDDSVVVHSLAFSSDGLLASGCEDGTLRVWNASGSQVWNSTSAHSGNITAVAFSPDGSMLVSGSLAGTAVIHSTGSWSPLRTLSGHSEGVCTVAFSPDGSKVATGSHDTTAMLWNTGSGTSLATLSGHGDAVTSVAFSPDGSTMVSGSRDHTAVIWSVAAGSVLQQLCPLTDSVWVIACSPDGQTVATASNDRNINLWRSSDGALLDTLQGHDGWISAIDFSPAGTTLASGGDELLVWDLSSGTISKTIPVSSNGVTSVAFSPDGTLLAAGGDAADQTIQLWDPSDGSLIRTLSPGHSNGVTVLEFSPDGSMLASGGRRPDHAVKLWDPETGALIDAFTGVSNNVEVLSFSPDGRKIAAAGSGEIQVWTVDTGARITLGSGARPVFGLAFSPDGATLAAADDGMITFWDLASRYPSLTWEQEASRVSCVDYAPAGTSFAYGRDDAVAALVDLSDIPYSPFAIYSMDITGSDMMMVFSNAPPNSDFILLSKTDLTDPAWTTNALAVRSDAAGAGSFTNPIAGSSIYCRLLQNLPPAFSVDSMTLADGTEDVPYSATIAGSASDPESDPLTYSKESGPAWLNVDADGALWGTPGGGDVGTNSFILRVAANGGSDTADLMIMVDPGAEPDAVFDWSETAGYNRWNHSPQYFNETENGITLVTAGRIFAGEGEYHALKYAYAVDEDPGIITMQVGGSPVNFKVIAIDISQVAGTDAGTAKHVRGMLGTTVQWEILPPENGQFSTFYTPDSGDMSLEIDSIEWRAGWGPGYPYESYMDNLQIQLTE